MSPSRAHGLIALTAIPFLHSITTEFWLLLVFISLLSNVGSRVYFCYFEVMIVLRLCTKMVSSYSLCTMNIIVLGNFHTMVSQTLEDEGHFRLEYLCLILQCTNHYIFS